MKTPALSVVVGDAVAELAKIPDDSVDCCVTSPPYWGLRDYGAPGQIGQESTFEAYLQRMVQVFREVRRVLRPTGTCWVNLGDAYVGNGGSGRQGDSGEMAGSRIARARDRAHEAKDAAKNGDPEPESVPDSSVAALKPKNIIGIPWRVAFALQEDGWCLRQDIIWEKRNPMPESVQDRCTRSHEYIFLLAKSRRYFWNFEAMQEDAVCPQGPGNKAPYPVPGQRGDGGNLARALHRIGPRDRRNRRSVWTMSTVPFQGNHLATYPPALVELCLRAGCPPAGVVLDPFAGSGTTGEVALRLGYSAILIEINPEYRPLIASRVNRVDVPLPLGLEGVA